MRVDLKFSLGDGLFACEGFVMLKHGHYGGIKTHLLRGLTGRKRWELFGRELHGN